MENEQIIESLSSLVRDPRLERLSLSLHTPNIFGILNATTAELRHSNFLAWLMTPSENHNLNTIFLKWFLREIFSSEKITWVNEFSLDSMDLAQTKVHREWNSIDILIQHPSFVIAIENKLYSSEHSDQLSRYFETLQSFFPDLNKAYVYLTIDGVTPLEEVDASQYTSVSYELVRSTIGILLDIYGQSLSPRVQTYIEDYLLILNRHVMKEHESVQLARELYRNHKEAIDFIIENIPDRIGSIREIIESTVVEEGYVLQTCNRYYARFLTRKLAATLPKTGTGWKGQECFLFEIAYWEKGLSLKFVISPGHEHNRKLLSEILRTLPGSKNASGKQWWTHFSDARKVNFTTERYSDDDEARELIKSLLQDNKGHIELAEMRILAQLHEFSS